MIFELNGATRFISNFAVCRWSMEAFGTSSNLNDLEIIVDNPLYRERIKNPMYGQEIFNPALGQYELIEPNAEPTILIDPNAKETMSVFPEFNDAYEFTIGNLMSAWVIMIVIIIAFSVAAGLVLRGLKNER